MRIYYKMFYTNNFEIILRFESRSYNDVELNVIRRVAYSRSEPFRFEFHVKRPDQVKINVLSVHKAISESPLRQLSGPERVYTVADYLRTVSSDISFVN